MGHPPRNLGRVHAEINITPLIDVLLVLLVIFMTIAPAGRHGLDVGLPQIARAEAPPPPRRTLVIGVAAGGVSLNGQPLSGLAELEQRLRDTLDSGTERTVFVQPTGGIAYWQVVEVLDVTHGAGAERVGLLPAKP